MSEQQEPNIITYGNFVKVIDNHIVGTVNPRPEWYDAATSQLLTDYQLATRENLYKVDYETNKPQYDPFYQILNVNSQDDWSIDSVNFVVYVTYTVDNVDLNILFAQKNTEIRNAFMNEVQYGKLQSSLGFPVDARRSGTNNDKDSVQTLLDIGQFPVIFRDANNEYHTLTKEDLEVIKSELAQKGVEIYAKKWQKEKELSDLKGLYEGNAITYDEAVQELKNFIVW